MFYIVCLAESIAGFFNRKSKMISVLLLLTFVILTGWSFGVADFGIYEARYYYYDLDFLKNQTEPLYTFIMSFFLSKGFSYRLFLILESIFMFSAFYWFISKETDNINFVLILYLIWPFCRDACILRTALATSIVYIALYFYLRGKKRDIVSFSILLLVASMIHYGMLFYYVLLIPALVPSKDNIIENRLERLFAYLFIGELIIFKVFPSLPFTGVLMNKINFVLNRGIQTSSLITAPGVLRTVFMFAFYCLLHVQVKKRLERNSVIIAQKRECNQGEKSLEENSTANTQKLNRIRKIFYINLYQLLCIPLYNYAPDLWRLQQILMILNYVEFSYYINTVRKSRYTKREFIFLLQSMAYAFTYLFIIVLKTDQFETVLRPLFENNILFKG